MKRTLKQLEQDYIDAQNKRERLIDLIATGEQELQQLSKEAQAAAESGDFEKYKKLKASRDDKEDALFVNRQQLNKFKDPVISREAVLDAWNDYAADYNKELAKDMKAFQEAKKKLAGMYLDLVAKQNVALKQRERCAEYLDIKQDPMNMGNPYEQFGMSYIEGEANLSFRNIRWATDDAAYFVASKVVPEESIELFNRVLRLHLSF